MYVVKPKLVRRGVETTGVNGIVLLTLVVLFLYLVLFAVIRYRRSKGRSGEPVPSIIPPSIPRTPSEKGESDANVPSFDAPTNENESSIRDASHATMNIADVRSLMDERIGFGRHARGGLDGKVFHVTTLSNTGSGSLREALTMDEPLWIVFDVEGTIHLDDEEVRCKPFKTIDGRGKRILIQGHGIRTQTEHVIITDLEFRRTIDDGIKCRDGHDCWFHHLKMGDNRFPGMELPDGYSHIKDYADGIIDITHSASNVTVSWCYFYDHYKGFLVGESWFRDPPTTNVTYHHNWFEDINSRSPLLQGGTAETPNRFHSFNNVRKNVGGFGGAAIDVRPNHSMALVENDLFIDSGSIGSNWNQNDDRDTVGYAWKIRNCVRRGGRSISSDRHASDVFTPDYPYTLENANALDYLEHETGPR